MIDLASLNDAQREAVLACEGPLLVLAGAGSGKTRVLTYRIAHIVEDLDVPPWNILAVTFTNKAAAEMRERLSALVPRKLRGMWIYTFHSMCVRILRANAERLGFTKDFAIYDADDSKRLIKDIMSDHGLSSKELSEAAVRSQISTSKNQLVGPEGFASHFDGPKSKTVSEVYKAYQKRLRRANAMDFDDLLFNAYALLKGEPQICEEYAERFRYILVDEYQDTNKAQYEITKMLASKHRNLMVVGDDDQSIYSWRGADISNILDFENDWPDAKTVRLEENYRSTSTILECANAVIANNRSRKKKALYTNGDKGEKVAVFLAADERDEGRWIASKVEELHSGSVPYDDIAVFYRTNAQSRILEDMFLRAGVPYRIVGGTKFFDRAEIRDVTAYLKAVVNPSDDVSIMRVVNTPRRGIGKTTIERISLTSLQRDISFFEACKEEALDPSCRPSTRKALEGFVSLIEEAARYKGDLYTVVDMIIEKTGLIEHLRAQNTEEANSRIENIQEFLGVVHDYADTHELVLDQSIDDGALDADEDIESYREPTLNDFMEWLSLRTDLDTLGDETDKAVTFMTVHSAKGLEFEYVFVAGMEETIFPHSVSLLENGVEEERRLAYVAITRAKKRLFLTCAARRRIFNDMQANARSRFINEMPSELLATEGVGSIGFSGTGWEKRGDRRGISGSGMGEEMYGGKIYGSGGYASAHEVSGGKAKPSQADKPCDYAVGDEVDHKTFGAGVVKAVDGDRISIYFKKSGKTKTLLKGYAPLVKLG